MSDEMIRNYTHLQVFEDLKNELQWCLNRHNAEASGKTDKQQLAELYLARLDDFERLCADQRRAVRHIAGLPVEPIAHEATAVLVGIGEQVAS